MAATEENTHRQERRGLLILLTYRTTLVGLLLLAIYGGFKFKVAPPGDLGLFVKVTFVYLGLVFISGAAFLKRWVSATNQALGMFLVDCIVIPLLVHSGGGITSALGILLGSSIALTSLLVRGRMVLFLAAIATFGIFSAEIYQTGLQLDTKGFTQAGLLGAVYFTIALLAAILSRRVYESESLAERHAQDLAELAQLNEQIIEQMNTGVLITSNDGAIRYFNQAARHLLEISGESPNILRLTSPPLDRLRNRWLEDEDCADTQTIETEHRLLRAQFRSTGIANSCLLIFLEDASEAMKQARQIKLASLGRLTAGIAHQIRNPLSSINHAAQLLAESEALPTADKRLLEIIRHNTTRVNHIIEGILQLSRRQEPRWEIFDLQQWLERFLETFCQQHELPREQIELIPLEEGNPAWVRTDATQLEQVINNLCENALRHSGQGNDTHLSLRLQRQKDEQIRLTLCDNGAGLSRDSMEKLFEPFFTTRSDGTGLGLYIAKELSEFNNIGLKPVTSDQGACFQLTFRQPPRHD